MFENETELLVEKIRRAGSILIFAHRNPDGDATGSVLALRHLILDNFGITADIAYDGNLPIYFDKLPGRECFIYAKKLPVKKYDLVISADNGSYVQIDLLRPFFDDAVATARLDHHKTGDIVADINIVDDMASSAAEVIYTVATMAGWHISANAATCIFAGMYTDTGGFQWVNNSRPYLVAADLVTLGARPREIVAGMNIMTRDDVMAECEVLSGAEFYYGGQLGVALVPNSLYKKLDSGETDIIKHLRRIRGVECVAILKEAHENEIGVSLRSTRIPVRSIAELFGGGGHDLAAGARINDTLPNAKKMIIDAFGEVFK